MADDFLEYYSKLGSHGYVGDTYKKGKNVRQVVNESKGELKDLYAQAFSAEKGGITASEFFGTMKSSLANKVNSFTSKFTTDPRQDDKIYIPVGAKTLTGEDFSSLYGGDIDSKSVETDNGKVDIIVPKTSYSTEMYYGDMKAVNKTTYSGLNDSDKAAYEIVLLTKHYASGYNSEADNAGTIAKEYTAKLDQYKNYCEQNNLNWHGIVQLASSELQRETCAFRDDGDKNNLYVTNLSHNLLLTGAGDDYVDQSNPIVEYNGYTYEDTMSLDMTGVGSPFKTIKNSIKKNTLIATSSVAGFMSNVVDLAQSGAAKLADKIKGENPFSAAVKRQLEHFAGNRSVEGLIDESVSQSPDDDYSF